MIDYKFLLIAGIVAVLAVVVVLYINGGIFGVPTTSTQPTSQLTTIPANASNLGAYEFNTATMANYQYYSESYRIRRANSSSGYAQYLTNVTNTIPINKINTPFVVYVNSEVFSNAISALSTLNFEYAAANFSISAGAPTVKNITRLFNVAGLGNHSRVINYNNTGTIVTQIFFMKSNTVSILGFGQLPGSTAAIPINLSRDYYNQIK